MDYKAIEKFVADKFDQVSKKDLYDLVASAIMFLDERGLIAIDSSMRPTLSAYLAARRKEQLGDKAGRVVDRNWREKTLSDVVDPSDTSLPDDDKMSRIASRTMFLDPKEIKRELETSFIEFEEKQDELRSLLPVAVFEAFERRLIPETKPSWTAGFDPLGLLILHRRARIRMKWKEDE